MRGGCPRCRGEIKSQTGERMDAGCPKDNRCSWYSVTETQDFIGVVGGFQPSAACLSPWLTLQPSRWTPWGPRISSPIGFKNLNTENQGKCNRKAGRPALDCDTQGPRGGCDQSVDNSSLVFEAVILLKELVCFVAQVNALC